MWLYSSASLVSEAIPMFIRVKRTAAITAAKAKGSVRRPIVCCRGRLNTFCKNSVASKRKRWLLNSFNYVK
jgi:hypothetical protein